MWDEILTISMQYCRNCGNEVKEEAYVCIKCGALLDETKKNKNSSLDYSNTPSFWLNFVSNIFIVLEFVVFIWNYMI